MHDHPHDHTDPTPDILNPRRAMLAGLGGLAAGAFLASTANAGPLTPPAGPIEPTPGPEPRIPIGPDTTPSSTSAVYRITRPGSYYLTENITGETGKNGIEIAAHGVTIDLMGFDLIGVPGLTFGIRTTASNLHNVTILNGSVRNWGSTGINLTNAFAGRIEGVRASSNGFDGISAGNGFSIINCTASSNSSNGFSTGNGCTVTNCAATSNGQAGISTGSGCAVAYFSAASNGDIGIIGFTGCTVTNCTGRNNATIGIACVSSFVAHCNANLNGTDGFRLSSGCLATNNTSHNNGTGGSGAGIRITNSNNRVEGNNCTNNPVGIQCAGSGCFIARNTCSSNASNWNIVAGNACFIVNAAQSGLIVGDSGGVSPGSPDPNANYTY